MHLRVSVEDQDLAEVLRSCNLDGLDLRAFTYPQNLINWRAVVKTYHDMLKDFKGALSLHGPYYPEICPVSSDPDIRDIARKRYDDALHAAEELGADRIVFHLNYLPIIRGGPYKEYYISRSIDYFRELVQAHPGPKILIENTWEPDHTILEQVICGVNNPRFRMCFDTGHFNVYANEPLETWLHHLDAAIDYVHLHNNDGQLDEHKDPLQGTFPVKRFLRHWMGRETPDICLELIASTAQKIESLKNFRQSLGEATE